MSAKLRAYLAAGALALSSGSIAIAADLDHDGLDDSLSNPGSGARVAGALIAIVDTEHISVGITYDLLTGLGYTVTLISPAARYDELSLYEMVLLPVSHGRVEGFGSLAGEYLTYVDRGGCLYIAQPNPEEESETPWAPYSLVLEPWYNVDDCDLSITDPNDCATEGLTPDDVPFPADTVVSLSDEWNVLVVGNATGSPSLLVATYGAGNVTVDLGVPGAVECSYYDDRGLSQFVSCCLQTGPVPVVESSWGQIKARYNLGQKN